MSTLRWTSRVLFALLSMAVASGCEDGSPVPAGDDDDQGAVVGDPVSTHDPADSNPNESADAAPAREDAEPARVDAGVTAERDAVATDPVDAGTASEQEAGPEPLDAAVEQDAASTDAAPEALDATADAAPAEELFTAVYALMEQNCTSCHGAGKSYGDFSTRELAYLQLVGMSAQGKACASDGGASPVRVVPGDPETSLLIMKLENRQPCGSQMPKAGPLPQADIDAFRAWVSAGAPEH